MINNAMQDSRSLLSIGINEYPSFRLEYCVSDAKGIASILDMREFGFAKQCLLLDFEANIQKIETEIINLMRGNASFKLLYFAGHGISSLDDAYLVTPDGDSQKPGISLNWLKNQIVGATGTVTVILDCCRAGAATIRDTEFGPLRSVDIDRIVPELGLSRFLLAATTSSGVAEESAEVQHGIFTFHIQQGLLGEAANREGIITPMGLFDYVAAKFEESGRQTPIFKGDQIGKVVLATGFSAAISGGDDTLEASLLDELEEEARQHVNAYLKEMSVHLDEWQSHGYKTASQLLSPMLRWFDRTSREYPDVLSREGFLWAHSEIQARLAQLGSLSIGTVTEQGAVKDCLGAGAFGMVWRIDPGEGRPHLALKVYHPHELQVKEKRIRFHRGYKAMEILDHPNIVKVGRFSESPVGFYMDYIEGPNLRQFGPTLDNPMDKIRFLMVIAETLQHAHGRHVIHRDVKPENILVTFDLENSQWEPYLTDFDLAWYSTATQVTREAFGVIFYAAPEQLAKPESSDAHAKTTDIFAFGQVAFFIITGSDPVPLDAADNVRALSERLGAWGNLEAAELFCSLYESCTEREPHNRTQDFRAVSESLYRVYSILTNRDPDQQVPVDRFVLELAFALAGLAQQQTGSHTVTSRSGRTSIELEEPQLVGEFARIQIALVHGNLQISGANNERARAILNAKLDRDLAEFPMARRRAGDVGTYRVIIEIADIQLNHRGVEICRQVIGRAVDSIEAL